ncbi:phasin family protein [Bradyrhizobium sp. RDM4]|uniref:phasin family protein n=1 Tax=Bradyrhizobium sp. RDM4 TaxID=3378765 RepID=UPI0038FD3116
MANERQEDRSTQNPEDKARRAAEKATEQTRRIGVVAAETSEQVAKTGANLLQQNAEMFQNTWRFGVDMITAMLGRSADHMGRALGASGDEAQEASRRSARNAESILYSATAVSKGVNDASRECLELARHQVESSMKGMGELWRCRTPQDFAAVQTDLLRETLERALQSSRRIADVSVKAVDDAATHMTETMKRAA